MLYRKWCETALCLSDKNGNQRLFLFLFVSFHSICFCKLSIPVCFSCFQIIENTKLFARNRVCLIANSCLISLFHRLLLLDLVFLVLIGSLRRRRLDSIILSPRIIAPNFGFIILLVCCRLFFFAVVSRLLWCRFNCCISTYLVAVLPSNRWSLK